MTQQEIYPVLAEILRDLFHDPDFVVTPQTSAKDHPQWDSFNHINIVVATERRFGVEISPGEIDSLVCVADFASLIAEKKRQAA